MINESRYNSLIVGRYIAPEVFTSDEYDTKADVFSFALIVQEVSTLRLLSLFVDSELIGELFFTRKTILLLKLEVTGSSRDRMIIIHIDH